MCGQFSQRPRPLGALLPSTADDLTTRARGTRGSREAPTRDGDCRRVVTRSGPALQEVSPSSHQRIGHAEGAGVRQRVWTDRGRPDAAAAGRSRDGRAEVVAVRRRTTERRRRQGAAASDAAAGHHPNTQLRLLHCRRQNSATSRRTAVETQRPVERDAASAPCVIVSNASRTNENKHTFNGPFSGTTRVSRYEKGKPIWVLLKQDTMSGSGISWAVCKSAPRSRQITTPAPQRSVFYRPDALPATQPTVSKH